MSPDQLEELLYEDESTSLDFKRDQYPFERGTDEEKGELLKDILAFANSWRRSDAYILIGVEEVKGGRSKPVGLSKHLDDAGMQQFVSAKTNRKIDFAYETASVDGMTIGMIRVPIQPRPSYLNKDYGKLKSDTVYIKRGSSTDVAKPDEISRMGAQTDLRPVRLTLVGRVLQHPRLSVVVAIKNDIGSGPARAPRLSIAIPGPFGEGDYGLDGNGNIGLPRIAQALDSPYRTYGGDTTTVVLAGFPPHDVIRIEYKGPFEKIPDRVAFKYILSAEGIDPIEGTLTVML